MLSIHRLSDKRTPFTRWAPVPLLLVRPTPRIPTNTDTTPPALPRCLLLSPHLLMRRLLHSAPALRPRPTTEIQVITTPRPGTCAPGITRFAHSYPITSLVSSYCCASSSLWVQLECYLILQNNLIYLFTVLSLVFFVLWLHLFCNVFVINRRDKHYVILNIEFLFLFS